MLRSIPEPQNGASEGIRIKNFMTPHVASCLFAMVYDVSFFDRRATKRR
jgi:hypothetical protein